MPPELFDRPDLPERRGWFIRWLARRDSAALLRLLVPRPGLTLLDVGCGAGAHAVLAAALGLSVYAVDKSERRVAQVRPHVEEALVGDVQTLALGRRFDRVLCFGVLDFVSDPARAMANLAAHLSPGGRLVIQVPNRSLAGRSYGLGYRLLHGVTPHLYDWRVLDRLARDAGLALVGRERPFLHNVLLGWA